LDDPARGKWQPVGAWADSILALQAAAQGARPTLGGPGGARVVETALATLEREWLFARTADGVHLTLDRGASWEDVPLPPGLTVTGLAVDLAANRLLLGTLRFGLFAADLPGETIVTDLLQPVHASPNPFGGTVVLRCTLPGGHALAQGQRLVGDRSVPGGGSPSGEERAAASASSAGEAAEGESYLLVLSIHGQVIRRLRDPQLVTDAGGESSLLWRWDGLDERGQPAPSGMYLLSAVAGTQRYAGKLIKLH